MAEPRQRALRIHARGGREPRAARLRAGCPRSAAGEVRRGRMSTRSRSRTGTSTTGATSSPGSGARFYLASNGPVPKPALWVQPGGAEFLDFARRPARLPRHVRAHLPPLRVRAGYAFRIGKLAITPTRVPHYRLETYAFRVQSNGAVLTYSGDSAPSTSSWRRRAMPTSSSVRPHCSEASSTASPGATSRSTRQSTHSRRPGRSACWSRTGRASCRHRASSSSPTTGSSSRSEPDAAREQEARACVRRVERAGLSGNVAARCSSPLVGVGARARSSCGSRSATPTSTRFATRWRTRASVTCSSRSRARPRLRLPGGPLAADRRRAGPRAPFVLRDAARRARVQQRAARAHWRVPARGLAESRRADARRARVRQCRARPNLRHRHGRVFFAIGLQAVASAAWLVTARCRSAARGRRSSPWLSSSRASTRRRGSLVLGDRRRAGVSCSILRDTVEMLGEPIGRRRAATWLGLSACTWTPVDARRGARRSIARHRFEPCSRRSS